MASVRIRRWHLVASWIAWWLGLFLVKFWTPLLTYWRITGNPNSHGSITVGYSGNPFVLVLWIFGPPLLFTLLWLIARRGGQR